jgi:hypothetical protein
VDLFPRVDHHRVGRLTEIVPVGRVESVPVHVSLRSGARTARRAYLAAESG